MVIIAYVLILVSVFLGITAIPNSFIGGFLGRLFGNLLLGSLFGSIIIWMFIDLLWVLFFSTHVPVLVFVIAFLILTFQLSVEKDNLNEPAKFMIAGEQWALVIVCIYTLLMSEQIQWY